MNADEIKQYIILGFVLFFLITCFVIFHKITRPRIDINKYTYPSSFDGSFFSRANSLFKKLLWGLVFVVINIIWWGSIGFILITLWLAGDHMGDYFPFSYFEDTKEESRQYVAYGKMWKINNQGDGEWFLKFMKMGSTEESFVAYYRPTGSPPSKNRLVAKFKKDGKWINTRQNGPWILSCKKTGSWVWYKSSHKQKTPDIRIHCSKPSHQWLIHNPE